MLVKYPYIVCSTVLMSGYFQRVFSVFCVMLFLFASLTDVNAQKLRVWSAKRVFYQDGTKIRVDDRIERQSKIVIKEKGKIGVYLANNWTAFITEPGVYNLDSAVRELEANRGYIVHDSIYNVLVEKNIHECNFYYCERGPAQPDSLSRWIETGLQGHLETTQPSTTVSWKAPWKYQGKYYVTIANIFEEYLDLLVTDKPSIDIDLTRYGDEHAIVFRVISEKCHKSWGDLIRIQKGN